MVFNMFLKKSVLIIFLATLMLHPVFAVGLMSSPIGVIPYKPGYSNEFNFIVRNFNYDVNISVGGDLSKYATLSPVMTRPDGMKQFSVKVQFPDEIVAQPGMHSIIVRVQEIGKPGGNVGVLTAVQKNIRIEVYATKKEIKVDYFDAPNSNEQEDMLFRIGVRSWTYQNISSVYAKINILGEDNESLAHFDTNKVTLPSGGSVTLNAEWNNAILKPGEYRAKAEVIYDGKSETVTKDFKIGTLMIKIKNYTSNFISGDINEFKVDVKNMWNNRIDNVYVDFLVDGAKVLQTPSANLGPWEEKTLSTYWNVSFAPGVYNGKVKIYYEDTFSEKNVNVNILEAKKGANLAIGIAIGVIVLLTLVFLILFFQRRMDKGEDSENKSDTGGDVQEKSCRISGNLKSQQKRNKQ